MGGSGQPLQTISRNTKVWLAPLTHFGSGYFCGVKMANFNVHVGTSHFVGMGYAAAGHFAGVPWTTSLLSYGLCAVSGMLPDVDLESKSQRESLGFVGIVVGMLMARNLDLPAELAVFIGLLSFVVIRFVLAELIPLFCIHRGMFHSVPASFIFGEITFLLVAGPVELRLFKAGAVVVGCFTHLILDEIYSLGKGSFGSAFKMFGKSWWANLVTYLLLIMFSIASAYTIP